MPNETEINILLKLRGQMEGEIASLQDALAIKRKAQASLSDTIDLLRGWHPEEKTVNGRASYDHGAIKDAITDFFVEHTEPVKIEEIYKPLQELGLVPTYSRATRTRVVHIMRTMPELTSVGEKAACRWMARK